MVLSQFHALHISPLGCITYLNMDEHVKTFSFPREGSSFSGSKASTLSGTFSSPASTVKPLLCAAPCAQGGGEGALFTRHIVGAPEVLVEGLTFAPDAGA